jgi:hypothetical protein
MGHKYISFLKKLTIFSLLLAIPGVIAAYTLPPEQITPTLPFLYLFFYSATTVVHYLLLKISEKRPTQFTNYFMLLTFGKLIFYLTIILAYIILFKDDAKPFVVSFLILYLFFTAFEVVQSLKQTGQENVPDGNKNEV